MSQPVYLFKSRPSVWLASHKFLIRDRQVYMRWNYWKAALLSALSDTAKAFGLNSPQRILTKLTAAVAAIIGAAYVIGGSYAISRMEVGALTATFFAILFAALYFWNLLGVPPRLMTEQRKELETAKAELATLKTRRHNLKVTINAVSLGGRAGPDTEMAMLMITVTNAGELATVAQNFKAWIECSDGKADGDIITVSESLTMSMVPDEHGNVLTNEYLAKDQIQLLMQKPLAPGGMRQGFLISFFQSSQLSSIGRKTDNVGTIAGLSFCDVAGNVSEHRFALHSDRADVGWQMHRLLGMKPIASIVSGNDRSADNSVAPQT